MVITIEELLAFKSQYNEGIKELERKMAVVDDLIVYAQAKSVEEVAEEVIEETELTEPTTNY